MRRTDIVAVGELAGEALAAGGGLIRELHEGIASRPLGILGPAAAPVRVIHEGVVRAPHLTQDGVVLGEQPVVVRPQRPQQARRAFDVGEQARDHPGREPGTARLPYGGASHRAIIGQPTRGDTRT